MMHRIKILYDNGNDLNGLRETRTVKGLMVKSDDLFIHVENDDGKEFIIGKKYIMNIKEL